MSDYLEEMIYNKLSGTVAITTIVPAARIYMDNAVENPTFPFITFQRVSTLRDLVLTDTVDLTAAVIVVHGYSKTRLEKLAIGKQIRLALQGYRGTGDGINVQRIIQENEIGLYEEDTKVYHVVQNYKILYLEP